MNRPGYPTPIRFRLVFFVWLMIGLFIVSLRTVSDYWMEWALLEPIGYLRIFIQEMLSVLIWASVTPAILHVCWTAADRRSKLLWSLSWHAVLFAAYLGAKGGLMTALEVVLGNMAFTVDSVRQVVFDWIELNLITYCLIVFAAFSIQYYSKYRIQDRVQRQLERQLAGIEFDGLKMQTQPEFLIRSLQRISTVLDVSPDAAEELLTRLSNLLRNTLVHANTEQVSLEEEISMFEDYLLMQKVAFPGFSYDVHVEPGAWVFKVPTMILQPLAEILVQEENMGDLGLDVRLEGDWLRLEMKLESAGARSESSKFFESHLERVRRRLRRLYAGSHTLNLLRKDGVLREIVLSLPLEAASDDHEYYTVF